MPNTASDRPRVLLRLPASPALPAIVATTEPHVQARFIDFFTATVRNAHTRRAYARDVADLLAWCAGRSTRSTRSNA